MENRIFTLFGITIIFSLIFLVGNISALNFDNSLKYSKDNKLVEIENSFGLPFISSKIGKVELTSHESVDTPINVIEGDDRIVMTYDFYDFENVYPDGIGDVEFVNMKNNKNIQKRYFFEEIVYETYDVPVVNTICNNPKDKDDCESQVLRYNSVKRIKERIPFNSKNIPNRNITLGLVVDVERGDFIDGKWTIAGKKLSRHATWNASFQSDLIGVWNFNNTGSVMPELYKGHYNLTGSGALTNNITTSVLPNGIYYGSSGTGTNYYGGTQDIIGGKNGTMMVWIQPEDTQLSTRNWWATGNGDYRLGTIENQIQYTINGVNVVLDNSKTYYQAGDMMMVTATWDTVADIYRIYINDTLVISSTTATTDGYTSNFALGGSFSRPFTGNYTDAKLWNRTLSLGEITSLYNSKTGIEFILIPNEEINLYTNLIYPQNNSIIVNSNPVRFEGSFSTSSTTNLTNTTLYIFNSSENIYKTNYTLINGTTNSTNRTLTNFIDGEYRYGFLTCGVNSTSSLCEFSQNFSFTLQSIFFGSEIYNNVTLEGSSEYFEINLTLASGQSISNATLFYNNTHFQANIDNSNLPKVVLSRSLTAPLVSSSTNKSFYWTTIINGLNYNSTLHNQTVENFNIDNCSIYTSTIFRLNVVDEERQLFLANASIETSLNIYNSNRDVLVSSFYGNFSNPLSICVSSAIINGSSYSLDMVTKYESPDHAIEYYNIKNQSFINSTQNQNITLYDLNSSDLTPFKIIFTDQFLTPISDVLVYIERQYISENTYKVVELPITDSNGETVAHLVRNDVLYNIRFVKNGILLASFEKITAFCQDYSIGDCQLSLSSTSSSATMPTSNTIQGIIFNPPNYNSSTQEITFMFTSSDGSSKTIFMNVSRNDIFGNRTLCDDTLISSSGSLICNIGNLSDTNVRVDVYVNGNLVSISSLVLDDSNYGNIGFIIWFVLTLALMFMFGDSKSGVLISLLLGVIGGITLGLSKGTIIGVGSAGLWIIILVLIAFYKLNKKGGIS